MQKCHADLIRIIFSVSVERGSVLHVRHDQLSKAHVLLAIDDSSSGWINANNPIGVDLELDLAHDGKSFPKALPDLLTFSSISFLPDGIFKWIVSLISRGGIAEKKKSFN